uniref:signal peptidase I n=1 Tax=Nakamurella endophytica TaxID=1748367 RepID=UPI001E44F60F|nr:signal peptidase I [Nakamurella endophytica]
MSDQVGRTGHEGTGPIEDPVVRPEASGPVDGRAVSGPAPADPAAPVPGPRDAGLDDTPDAAVAGLPASAQDAARDPATPSDTTAAVPQPPVDAARDASGDAVHAASVERWRRMSDRRNRKAKRPFWVELPILLVVAFVLTFLIQTFIAKVYYVPSGSMEQTLHGVSSGGDRILASKIVYDFRDPHPGDVVVFKGPDTWAPEADIPGPSNWFGKLLQSLGSVIGIAPPNEKDFVKRVIAVGGQTVACCDDQGNVTVDGRSLVEPYLYEPLPFTPGTQDCAVSPDRQHYESERCFAPYTVPAGQLWVMGDHRSESSDSSFLCWGLTPEGEKAYQAANVNGDGCNRPIPQDNVIGKAIFIVMPPSRWHTIGDPDIDPQAQALSAPASSAVPAAGGLLLTGALRGGWALRPARRRARRARRAARRAAQEAS